LSKQLIIAGAHRSGTSATAQLLHRAGLFLGEHLDPPSPSNPYGLFEDREFQAWHNAILLDNGTTWQVTRRFLPVISPTRWNQLRKLVARREAEHPLWGWKEPRTCLLLEIWKHILPNAKCLGVYRHFADSSYSLERRAASELASGVRDPRVHRRFSQEPDLAPRIWLAHNEALLSFARRHPGDVLIVSFESLRGGFPLVELLQERWRLGLTERSFSDVFDPKVTSERPGPQPLSDPRLAERLEITFAELQTLEQETAEPGRKEANAGVVDAP
jgi:Sulfotransferase family